MRIAIIDESAARAAVIAEGLTASGLNDITVLIERQGLVARLQELAPDVVLIDLGNPRRDELEELFAVSRAISRPIAMFVDSADDNSIEAAIDAGVSAYVVDGMRPARRDWSSAKKCFMLMTRKKIKRRTLNTCCSWQKILSCLWIS